MELATGAIFALVTWGWHGTIVAAAYCALAATMVAVSLIEYAGLRAPLAIAGIGTAIAQLIILVGAGWQGHWRIVGGSLLVGTAIGLALIVILRSRDPECRTTWFWAQRPPDHRLLARRIGPSHRGRGRSVGPQLFRVHGGQSVGDSSKRWSRRSGSHFRAESPQRSQARRWFLLWPLPWRPRSLPQGEEVRTAPEMPSSPRCGSGLFAGYSTCSEQLSTADQGAIRCWIRQTAHHSVIMR